MSYVKGFKVWGDIESSGVFKEITMKDRLAREAAIKSFIDSEEAAEAADDLIRTPPPFKAEKILHETKEEQKKGWLKDFLSKQEMDRIFGRGGWRFVPRFLISQSLRDRLIDDAKRGKQNYATIMGDTIFTISLDFMAECLYIMTEELMEMLEAETGTRPTSLPSWFNLGMALDDLPDAYKGCPIDPEHARACAVAIWHSEQNDWVFAIPRTMVFGLASAVNAFNRLPTMTTAAARRMLAVPAGAFFDDVVVFDSSSSQGSGSRASNFILRAVGAPPSKEKAIPWGQHRTWLGMSTCTAEVAEEGTATVQAKDANIHSLDRSLTKAIATMSISTAEASKARGQAGWTGSLAAGKCGRTGTEVLKRHQYGDDAKLTEEEAQELTFLKAIASAWPAKTLQVWGRKKEPVLVYSDASYEPGTDITPRLGWVVFPGKGSTPLGRSADVPLATYDSWIERRQQIFPAEAVAPLAVLLEHPEELRGRGIFFFIDNEAAVAACIRGASRCDDVGLIVQAIQWEALNLGCRCWFEWIDSKSNPSDGLSRDGLEDEWTLRQNWHLDIGHVPDMMASRFSLTAIVTETLGL